MIDPSHIPYNRRSLSQAELEERIQTYGDQIHINRIIDAYDMARSVHASQVRNDNTPFFDHTARTVRIIMDELGLYDTDLITAAFLHDVLEDSSNITRDVLEYNFGSYVAYVVETLTKDLAKAKTDPDNIDLQYVSRLKKSSHDCILIKLAARLDNVRCITFNLKRNPVVYLANTLERYLPIADASNNPRLHTLAAMIRQEANTLLG
ncbi:MAG: bifunctional (p)ppGpp synthetase/guanosine-3',5'-bis(diphosphate) 3'-pyrophosphohydrolase [Ignavibacteria bacterium]|nr:bifunctional (p)ppGpp synthetase/guanosine-3',5'-bis(diphosphate) 3'-pyrophosphohydrolase [Ignavibacteria bacterium]